ncbi:MULTISPECIES: ParB/RepB/Spo0J family partition protein [unclassified Sphingopyxis]|uniref:ParB/RepB/Spo0J family partition protein n=1 Tax=unclassified Sphingopyxis TaxID=2614943 RepID=UPI000736CCA5|nr:MULTISPECIES: ParB/RepB/Spo0J family partition protein [unclassified Sphingopyxis]KTE21708.1 chromosome partitioning protein ParB [Sphingopyxis sp. H050]KTE39577.1 chromosome partitioning protein ParB [Sphingopyxis sp. HIX]KTE78152.1 chromosome partitioning protein ParB [Sphingopyxis sp. HXXIV]
MQYPILYAPAANCSVSPLNVRKHSNATADSELAANLGETGVVLQNLIGVAVKRKKDHFSIIGGGRRLRAVHDQIAQGKLPADFLVPVMVMANEKDAIEMSLTENYYNLAMNPADACEAFRNMIDKEGKTTEQVAKRLGLTRRFVEGRLRLANLADPIFEALRCEQITLDIAIAYASTSDTGRQAGVFEELGDSYHSNNVGEIRRRLAAGSYKGADPKAVFVGREDYETAGGRIDGDLFSSTDTETWLDGDILERLAEEKLVAAAQAIREREGFAEVRAIPAGRIPYMETCQLEHLDGEPVPLSEDAAVRKAAIEAEVAEIERVGEDVGAYDEAQYDRLEALNEELETIEDTGSVFTDEQRATAIAYVVIDNNGQPMLHEQLYVLPAADEDAPGDEGEDEEDDGDGGEGEDDGVQDEKDEVKFSARLSDELAMMKTELLAVHVASDPHFALDLGTFIMVDTATRTYGSFDMPSELRASAPHPRVANFDSGMAAAEAWAKLDAALDRSWANHKDIEQRYDGFCSLDDEARAAWLGWAVARTLQSVPDGAAGSGFLNHLGAKLGIDVAAWWRPTARNFFDRITRPAILKLFAAIGGSELASRYAASRKYDLAVSAEKLFAGTIIMDNDAKERALVWLPGAMRFVAEADQVGVDFPCDADGDGATVTAEEGGSMSAAA